MTKKKSKSGAKPNYMGWVIAAVIVIVVIVLVMRTQAPADVTTPTDQITTEGGKVAKVQTAPEAITCDLNYVIGKKGACMKTDGDAKVPVMNSGKGAIPGMWFEAITVDGKTAYFKSTESIGVKEIKDYTLELEDWGAEIGSAIKSVTILPMTSDGKSCKNAGISLQVSACT